MPMWTLPPSVTGLLAWFAPCFTAPTFQTFTALACGFLAQTGPRTVTGMLLGAMALWPLRRTILECGVANSVVVRGLERLWPERE